MGGGGPNIDIGGAVEEMSEAVSDTGRIFKKAVEDAGKFVEKNTVTVNAVNELDKAYKRNETGINQARAIGTRAALAYSTGGLSETMGGGTMIQSMLSGEQAPQYAEMLIQGTGQSQGGGMGFDQFGSELLNIGLDKLRNAVSGGGGSTKKVPNPTTPTQTVYLPNPEQDKKDEEDQKQMTLGMFALAGIALFLVMKKR